MAAKAKNKEQKQEDSTFNDDVENTGADSVDLNDVEAGEIDSGDETFEADGDVQSGLVEIDAEHLARLEAEAKENFDKYLRAVAEFENFKKRMIRERADLLKYAGESMARDLLEVLDDLERAVQVAMDAEANPEKSAGSSGEFVAGVKLIKDRFISIFDKHGIKGAPAVGQPFDPNTHQALASVPVGEVDPNIILEEFKKAYYFKDKLLRVGQAVVSAAPID